jgi:hypothetical protein
MTKKKMFNLALITGILCVVLSVVVFLFADGLRRWYSGLFFLLIGIVMLLNAFRWRKDNSE